MRGVSDGNRFSADTRWERGLNYFHINNISHYENSDKHHMPSQKSPLKALLIDGYQINNNGIHHNKRLFKTPSTGVT
jgi:hypothetical protein